MVDRIEVQLEPLAAGLVLLDHEVGGHAGVRHIDREADVGVVARKRRIDRAAKRPEEGRIREPRHVQFGPGGILEAATHRCAVHLLEALEFRERIEHARAQRGLEAAVVHADIVAQVGEVHGAVHASTGGRA